MSHILRLRPDTNQALGLGLYAVQFCRGEGGPPGNPSQSVIEATVRFFTDAQLCGLSALALGANAPTVLWQAAHNYKTSPRRGVSMFGSSSVFTPEWAVLAKCAAVREWDANGTSFADFPEHGHRAGEFGHNDYCNVCIAAAQLMRLNGEAAVRGMIVLDEIRVRLGSVFGLKECFVDHVLHGAIATAAVWGAMRGATPEQIEGAIGMVVAHHVPMRAIRAGHELSDSKGASAGFAAKSAIEAVELCMLGFNGPKDIFRNPQALFRLFAGPEQKFYRFGNTTSPNPGREYRSPFELILPLDGEDFAIRRMHFKLGLYEHQSAGGIQALFNLLLQYPTLLDHPSGGNIRRILIKAYGDAYRIIGDPAKMNPMNRQSADHSMAYIIATLLRRALETKEVGWKELMMMPDDYSEASIFHPFTRALMSRIEFAYGGPEYDAGYPEGIPTSMEIATADGRTLSSGMIMFPGGHAQNSRAPNPVDLDDVLNAKWQWLGGLALDDPTDTIDRYLGVATMSAAELAEIDDVPLVVPALPTK